ADTTEADLAKALGYKSAEDARVNYPGDWNKAVGTPEKVAESSAGKRIIAAKVNQAVDDAIPPSGDTKGANLAAKDQADFYLKRGDVAQAQAAVATEAKRAGLDNESLAERSQFPPPAFKSTVPEMTPEQRADALDDKIVRE